MIKHDQALKRYQVSISSTFYVRIFWTKVVCTAFSSYVLSLTKKDFHIKNVPEQFKWININKSNLKLSIRWWKQSKAKRNKNSLTLIFFESPFFDASHRKRNELVFSSFSWPFRLKIRTQSYEPNKIVALICQWLFCLFTIQLYIFLITNESNFILRREFWFVILLFYVILSFIG